MAQAQMQMDRGTEKTELEALLAGDSASRAMSADAAGQAVQPGLPLLADRPERNQPGSGQDLGTALAGHSSECPRARAAQQLARQAEEEAQKYLESAARVSTDLQLSRVRRRMAWTLTPRASDEEPT
jgi:hypothetical protein